ncbi:MAG: PEP-CTERM sorting domain-containing protein [Phycisphaerae bacterium]|nr:PEP-CTERM sorting domain-containing protein [Phycisphaerae bacterium]
MKTKLRTGLLLTAVLGLAVAPAGAALVNPSFETPVIPEGQVELNAVPTGWTIAGSTPYLSKVVTPPDQDQYVDMAKGSALYQISDMVMETGVTYTASIYAKCDREISGDNVYLGIVAGDYTTVVASTTDHSDTDTWVLLTTSYTCTEEYNGQLAGVRLGQNTAAWCWQGYDMATLTPEPATMGLLAVGGLATLFRRKRR